MEHLSLLCSVIAAISGIFSVIIASATLFVQPSHFSNSPDTRRHRLLASLIMVCFAGALIGAGLALKPPPQASTNEEKSQQSSCPCPEVAKTSSVPSTSSNKSTSSKPSANPKTSDSNTGVNFIIKGIKLSSDNALMGDFPIKYKVASDETIISIVNPDFRVGSDNEHPGSRWVTQLQVFIGEHSELVKISRGQTGIADKSELFDLTELKVIRNQGEQSTLNKAIELSVPRRIATNLAGKSVLVRMYNRLGGSSKPFKHAYALSERNVFSDR